MLITKQDMFGNTDGRKVLQPSDDLCAPPPVLNIALKGAYLSNFHLPLPGLDFLVELIQIGPLTDVLHHLTIKESHVTKKATVKENNVTKQTVT